MNKKEEESLKYIVSSHIQDIYDRLLSNEMVQNGLKFIKEDHENTLVEQKDICGISAPTFKEEVRAKDYMIRLQELGLENVQMDIVGNVFGIRSGTGNGPKLIVAAHLDTVFPEGTNTAVLEKEGKFYAPGIADDTRGLAEILSIIRAFNETNIQTQGDIVFCGNVGEEGLGDLRGIKQLFRDNKDIDGFISIDGSEVSTITYLATGSHRYEINYEGPGGHSFGAFGLPSAIHALGRAMAKIADLDPPKEPKTTFTIGIVSGGTSVNVIAEKASMVVDMRSNSEKELLKLESEFLEIVKSAAAEENLRWNSNQITVDIKLLGDRPAGSQSANEPIVQAVYAAGEMIGIQSKLSPPGSTDANIPISLGIPAIAVGRGGVSGGIHSKNEWFDPTDAYLGPQKTFLTILSLVGMKDVSSPLLDK